MDATTTAASSTLFAIAEGFFRDEYPINYNCSADMLNMWIWLVTSVTIYSSPCFLDQSPTVHHFHGLKSLYFEAIIIYIYFSLSQYPRSWSELCPWANFPRNSSQLSFPGFWIMCARNSLTAPMQIFSEFFCLNFCVLSAETSRSLLRCYKRNDVHFFSSFLCLRYTGEISFGMNFPA